MTTIIWFDHGATRTYNVDRYDDAGALFYALQGQGCNVEWWKGAERLA